MMKVPLHTCIIVFICTTLQYMDFILSSQNFGKCRKSFKTLSMERGLKVDPFYAFESPVSLNVYQCAELCLRRKLCKSSSFLADQDICLLNSVVLSDLNAVNDVNAVYIHKNDNEASLHDVCANHKCTEKEACMESFGSQVCVHVYNDIKKTCGPGWTVYSDSCYFFSAQKVRDWSTAVIECNNMSAVLVEVQTREENDFLKTKASTIYAAGVFLGASDSVEDGVWVWQGSKTNVSFTDWAPGKPLSKIGIQDDEDCLAMLAVGGFQWDDFSCSFNRYYICEKEPALTVN